MTHTDFFDMEYRRLKGAYESKGFAGQFTKNRQHYLRWDSENTPRNLQQVGITHDSSFWVMLTKLDSGVTLVFASQCMILPTAYRYLLFKNL